MNKNGNGFLTGFALLVLVTVLALPTVAFAQGKGKHKGRGKPTEVFVNEHDARDGRWDKDNGRRRRGNNDDWRNRDRNGDGVIDWRDNVNNTRDRNGDGVIDWRDNVNNGDRNGDGVIDWRDNVNNDDWRNRNRRNSGDGYGNYGGSFDLRQTALNAGFADGVKEGRRDRDRGEQFEFRDESGYQSASRDYSSRLGDRGLYMTYYRQAFENGYRDGYAGY